MLSCRGVWGLSFCGREILDTGFGGRRIIYINFEVLERKAGRYQAGEHRIKSIYQAGQDTLRRTGYNIGAGYVSAKGGITEDGADGKGASRPALLPGRDPAYGILFHSISRSTGRGGVWLSGGVCMTAEEHRKFLGQDFDDVKIEELKDISKIRIGQGRTVEEKKEQYLKRVGNPYLVRVGSTLVKIRFANNGVSFEDAFEGLLLMG